MSFDQPPDEVATGEWYLDELYRAWRAASGEADDAYANWSRSLTHGDYDRTSRRPIGPMRRLQHWPPSTYVAAGVGRSWRGIRLGRMWW